MRVSAPEKSILFTTVAGRPASAWLGFNRNSPLGLSSSTISLYGRYAIISYKIHFLGYQHAALDRYGVARRHPDGEAQCHRGGGLRRRRNLRERSSVFRRAA